MSDPEVLTCKVVGGSYAGGFPIMVGLPGDNVVLPPPGTEFLCETNLALLLEENLNPREHPERPPVFAILTPGWSRAEREAKSAPAPAPSGAHLDHEEA
jgi:hypothetical protein